MARTFNGSHQRLHLGAPAVAGYPCTMGAWVRPNGSDFGVIASVSGGSAQDEYFYLYMQQGTPRVGLFARTFAEGGQTSEITSTLNLGQWYLLVASLASPTSRTCYKNEGEATEGTANIPAPVLDSTTIGANYTQSAFSTHLNADIAMVFFAGGAFWADDVAQLYQGGIGLDPALVRPDLLVSSYRLLEGDDDRDWWGRNHLTADNDPGYTDGPPIIYRGESGIAKHSSPPVETGSFLGALTRGLHPLNPLLGVA